MYKLKALYQYQNLLGNGASHTERFLLKIYQLVCLLLFFSNCVHSKNGLIMAP